MSKRDVLFSLLLLPALGLTLGIKAWSTRYGLALDSAVVTRALQARLASQGFATRHERHLHQSDVIEAVRGACRLRARDGAASSQYARLFEQQSAGLGPVRYVHRGIWHTSPPLLRMQIDKAAAHVLARLGLSGTFPATIAIAARGCDPAAINLDGLSAVWAPQSGMRKAS